MTKILPALPGAVASRWVHPRLQQTKSVQWRVARRLIAVYNLTVVLPAAAGTQPKERSPAVVGTRHAPPVSYTHLTLPTILRV